MFVRLDKAHDAQFLHTTYLRSRCISLYYLFELMLDESLYLPCHSSSGCFRLSNRVTDGEIYLVSVRQQQVRRGRDPLALVSV